MKNANPYTIFDGPWGGFGPTFWFRFGENGDVWEINDPSYKGKWIRKWNNTEKVWEKVTSQKNTPKNPYKKPKLSDRLPPFLCKRQWIRIKAYWDNKNYKGLIRYLVTGKYSFFDLLFVPMIARIPQSILTEDLVAVQPMAGPTDTVFYCTFKQDNISGDTKHE